jgi:3'(2'), 5'-bisphosphate nucleotidase
MSVPVGLLDALTELVLTGAAAAIATLSPDLPRRLKADRSPVTAADEASEAAILDGLARLLPGVPVVSEEASEHAAPPDPGSHFLLLDPLDGTRELLAGRDEYTINLALVQDGAPVLGVVGAPALGFVWRGMPGHGAERLAVAGAAHLRDARRREPIRCRPHPPRQPVAVVSRSHLDADTRAFVDQLPDAVLQESGSALKFCRIAEGAADVYPRLAPTREWDIAAGHAVVAAAGGVVLRPDGAPLRYGGREHGFVVPSFIAWGERAWAAQLGRAQDV